MKEKKAFEFFFLFLYSFNLICCLYMQMAIKINENLVSNLYILKKKKSKNKSE